VEENAKASWIAADIVEVLVLAGNRSGAFQCFSTILKAIAGFSITIRQ
jgi:hypothetical protein